MELYVKNMNPSSHFNSVSSKRGEITLGTFLFLICDFLLNLFERNALSKTDSSSISAVLLPKKPFGKSLMQYPYVSSSIYS